MLIEGKTDGLSVRPKQLWVRALEGLPFTRPFDTLLVPVESTCLAMSGEERLRYFQQCGADGNVANAVRGTLPGPGETYWHQLRLGRSPRRILFFGDDRTKPLRVVLAHALALANVYRHSHHVVLMPFRTTEVDPLAQQTSDAAWDTEMAWGVRNFFKATRFDKLQIRELDIVGSDADAKAIRRLQAQPTFR